MKLIGLLSWFDEPVSALATCIQGLHHAGVDHLVAVDGRYALYPGGSAVSHPDQHAVVHGACRTFGMAYTVHAPQRPWSGNEVEKRTRLFDFGWTVAEPGDWYMVMDADQVVTTVPDDLRERLEHTCLDAAQVRFVDTAARRANRPDWPVEHDVRCLFRAQPIRVEVNHYTYVADDGRVLWAGHDSAAQVPGLDLTDLVVEHRPGQRPRERQQAKNTYYTTRDTLGVERGTCARCDRRAVVKGPVRWQLKDGVPVSQMAELCAQHAEQADRTNRRRLRAWGIDPEKFRWAERYTPPTKAA